MAESNIEIVIRMLKEGKGDQEVIAALEKIKASGQEAGDASKKTGEDLDVLQQAGGRTAETLMRAAVVNQEYLQTLKSVELAAKSLKSGLIAKTLALGGVIAAGGIAIGVVKKYRDEMIAAWEVETKSSGDLADILERRRKTMERYGLSARATSAEIVAFNKIQRDAISGMNELFTLEKEGLARREQEHSLLEIEMEANARRNQIRLQTRAIEQGPAAFDIEAEATRAEVVTKVEQAMLKTAAAQDKQRFLQIILEEAEEKLLGISKENTKEREEQNKKIEQTRESLAKAKRETELAAAAQKEILETSKIEMELIDAKNAREKQRIAEDRASKILEFQGKTRSLLEDTFALEAQIKGVEDTRVAGAIAYLEATGRTADAARLTTLELEKQKKSLAELSPLQQAGRGIAGGRRGLNVEAIAAQGGSLRERSELRTLAGDFERDLQAERRRLQRGPNRDQALIQQQLAGFAERRLAESPTLAKALGVPVPQLGGPLTVEAPKTPIEKEREGLIKTAELGKATDVAGYSRRDQWQRHRHRLSHLHLPDSAFRHHLRHQRHRHPSFRMYSRELRYRGG
ncbi:MAG: hypothetical protein HY360_23085 [Verrucomicrobia bacterium]|nr:hypothetical protein [Verrucomicrobiota bacterium]